MPSFCSLHSGRTGLLHALGCLLLLGPPSAGFAAEEPRTWTDVQGRPLKATFLSLKDTGVELRLANGNTATVPLNQLSPADRQYAQARGKVPAPDASTAPAWPGEVALESPPETKTVKEDAEAGEFVYETDHYEFRCDAKLGVSVVREFARIFEASRLLAATLPLDLQPAPEPGRQKFQALLFKNKEDYFKAGAIPGSAGVYMGGKQCLMVPMESLGVREVGKRFALDRDVDNSTLIHEITHQMMNHWIAKLPTWYVEGAAEYAAAAKYRLGRFSLTRMGENVVAYLRQNKGVRDKEWVMWNVSHLMQIEGQEWASAIGGGGAVAMRNYASSALLTFYFYHLDDAGDGRHMIEYLRAIKAGTLQRLAAERHLLRGRDGAVIEKELAQKMRRWGLDLSFTGPGSPDSGEPEEAATGR
jgi:hypothetical protein